MFFSAGYETTSNTALFCLYELACNSDIQDKVYSELFDILEEHSGEISYQALQEMSYMEQVINGTFNSCEIADLCLLYLYKSRTVQYNFKATLPPFAMSN